MVQRVLIPTDFTIESLNTVRHLLNNDSSETTFDIILFFGFRLPNSTRELIFFSKSKLIYDVSNPRFEEACLRIKKDYVGQVNSLELDIFTGINKAAFQNYLEAKHIDKVYVPVKYQLKLPHKRSFNLLPFLYKSGIDVHEVGTMTGNE